MILKNNKILQNNKINKIINVKLIDYNYLQI